MAQSAVEVQNAALLEVAHRKADLDRVLEFVATCTDSQIALLRDVLRVNQESTIEDHTVTEEGP